MLAINRIAPIACTTAIANVDVGQRVEHREEPVDQLLLVEDVAHAGLALHRLVEILVLVRVVELDDERRRERVLAGNVFELRQLHESHRCRRRRG